LGNIQLDSKLENPSDASFVGRSGNIPLAWTLTFVLIAVLFIGFAIYHRLILPHPAEDQKNDSLTGKGDT
jgi:MFS transporter, PAT family, beta-lactamase induction signal transducer AmpG